MFSRRFLIAQIFFLIAAAALGIVYLNQRKPVELPVYAVVADFKLTDQNNKPVVLDTFKGKVWVVDFMFTTCGSICPMMTKNMAGLYKETAAYDDVRLVSVSVNPENDTPAALNAYAKKYNAEGDRWLFLTGDRAAIQKLAVGSFKIGDTKDIIFHSPLFVLVDRKGRVRGYYDGTDDERLKHLHEDLLLLRKER